MQGAQHGAGAVPFDDEMIARKLAAIFHQFVDTGIVERADHDVHRLRHQGMGEWAELPVAEMGGSEKDAPASLFRFQIMLRAVVTYPLLNVLAINLRETREDPD